MTERGYLYSPRLVRNVDLPFGRFYGHCDFFASRSSVVDFDRHVNLLVNALAQRIRPLGCHKSFLCVFVAEHKKNHNKAEYGCQQIINSARACSSVYNTSTCQHKRIICSIYNVVLLSLT